MSGKGESEMMEKPTIEQIAWVCKCFIINAAEQGTYRYLLYDVMGLDESAYTPVQLAGGLEIHNALCVANPAVIKFAYDYIKKEAKHD